MIKLLYTWKDNPDLSPEECDRHYREHHTKLAMQGMAEVPGVRAYVTNRVTRHYVHDYNGLDAREAAPPFDRFVEVYFDDMESIEALFARDHMQAVFEDHPNFMETNVPASMCVYEVDEEIPYQRAFRV